MTIGLQCEDISARFAALPTCETTDQGLRFATHCLYPSFEPVYVFVVKHGDGMIVHDGGGAARNAWIHGRDSRAINNALGKQANLHHLSIKDETLISEVQTADWLPSAIMAVANASATAAREAGETAQAVSEATLRDMIHSVLVDIFPNQKHAIAEDYPVRGKSGKEHRFDFAVLQDRGLTLIDSVSPHHVSVAARYVSFADTYQAMPELRRSVAVYQRKLDDEDIALLAQFADVVPYKSLRPGLAKRLSIR